MNSNPVIRFLVRVKYHIGPVLVFAPLSVAVWKCSLVGVILSSLAAAAYFTVRFLVGQSLEAYECIYENGNITCLFNDGSSQRIALDSMECYCELPYKYGRGVVFQHRIVVKLKDVEKPIMIEVDAIGWDLLQIIKRNAKKVPRNSLCRPPSIWICALQVIFLALMAISWLYVGQWL